jgi:predicted RNA binding protein YcfA (HicA-like mRNA interferase family)
VKSISGRQFAKILEKRGWTLKRVSASHFIYYKPNHQIISLPIHGNADLKRGLLRDLMKIAGLTEADLS